MDIWVGLYLLQLFLNSLALGCITYHLPKIIHIPGGPRFLLGFCLTPFVLGLWMLLLAALMPGVPRSWYLVIPSMIAALVLFFFSGQVWHHFVRTFTRAWRCCDFRAIPWVTFLTYFAAILVLLAVTLKLVILAGRPVLGFDALQYLGEALPFAETRSLDAINGFHDSSDGTRRGDIHGFMWPAFLSHALITTGSDHIGFPNDLATRAAFQVTFIYMALSVVTLSSSLRLPGTSPLALLLLIQVPQFSSVANSSGRDAYRIIPLMLLASVLLSLSPQRISRRFPLPVLIVLAILSAFSLAGHTLNGLVVIGLFMAWAIWNIFSKPRWIYLLLVGGSIAFGLLLSGTQYIRAYIETGKLMGNEFYDYEAIAGTPLEEVNQTIETARLEGTADAWQRIGLLFSRDGYRVSVIGSTAALFILIFFLVIRTKDRRHALLFLGLIILASLLPMVGVFDLGGFSFSKWFVRNFRYALHWYAFAAVCASGLFCFVYGKTLASNNRILSYGGQVLFVLLLVLTSYESYASVRSNWLINDWAKSNYLEDINILKQALKQLPPGEKLLLDDLKYNYYLSNQAVLLYSKPAWNLIQAKNERQVSSEISRLGIGAVALSEKNINGWWDRIPLLTYLWNPEAPYMELQDGNVRVYIKTQYEVVKILELPNNGFEKSAEGGWEQWTTIRAEPDTPIPHNGAGAGCFRSAEQAADLPWVMSGTGGYGTMPADGTEKQYALTSSKDYQASAWVRVDPASGKDAAVFMYIQQFLEDGQMKEDFLGSLVGRPGEYQPLVAYFHSSPQAKYYRILFRANYVTDQLCIDDVRIKEVIIPSASFENLNVRSPR